MPVTIEAQDRLSRCIVYARFFDGNFHTDSVLWSFGKTQADGASHESAVLRRLAVNDDEVHRIGCNIAAGQNEKRGSPPPGETRRYYCGFRSAVVGDIPKTGEGFRITIVNLPEDGEESHVDVALWLDDGPKSQKATWRTNAGLVLAERFDKPVAHVCACDEKDGFHPLNRWGQECLTAKLPSPGEVIAIAASAIDENASNVG